MKRLIEYELHRLFNIIKYQRSILTKVNLKYFHDNISHGIYVTE